MSDPLSVPTVHDCMVWNAETLHLQYLQSEINVYIYSINKVGHISSARKSLLNFMNIINLINELLLASKQGTVKTRNGVCKTDVLHFISI